MSAVTLNRVLEPLHLASPSATVAPPPVSDAVRGFERSE
jgi:hypothetical protein